MNFSSLLQEAGRQLTGPSAALEAEVLLRHLTVYSRAELFCRLNQPADKGLTDRYLALIDRLKAGEPLQYLTGRMEFYGLDFEVNPAVLIPRPETELMVEKAIALAQKYPNPAIADIGCGSGAVAVALARRVPQACVTAADLSQDALKTARRNAARHQCADISFVHSDLLQNIADRHFDIICANLPYVPAAEVPDNRFEPRTALDGGPDGLDLIRRLVSQVAALKGKPDWLLLEFGTGQAAGVRDIINRFIPESQTEIIRDFIPLERISVTRLS